MSISQDELKKIAKKLSKLPDSNEALAGNINDILNYVDLLSEVNTEGVVPTVSVIPRDSILREDVEIKHINGKELLNCSPQSVVSGHIALPNIMK